MSPGRKITGTIRIEADLAPSAAAGLTDDSTLDQLLASFAHQSSLDSHNTDPPGHIVASGRLSRTALMAADSLARADLAALVQELDDEFAALADVLP